MRRSPRFSRTYPNVVSGVEHYENSSYGPAWKPGRYFSLTVSPIKNAEGKIVGASKIARDITERKAQSRR